MELIDSVRAMASELVKFDKAGCIAHVSPGDFRRLMELPAAESAEASICGIRVVRRPPCRLARPSWCQATWRT